MVQMPKPFFFCVKQKPVPVKQCNYIKMSFIGHHESFLCELYKFCGQVAMEHRVLG